MVLGALGEHDAAVWLFGSCARGDARQHSDIDIEENPIPYDVDLVDLRQADEALVDQVRREGVKWRGWN